LIAGVDLGILDPGRPVASIVAPTVGAGSVGASRSPVAADTAIDAGPIAPANPQRPT
jgi:hypothetical protein